MGKNTIILKNYNNNFEEFTVHAELYPGMLCEMDSDGELKPHATAGGTVGPVMVAIENALEGEGIADAYAAADKARAIFPVSGDELLMLLADGQNVSKADKLESNGDGYLRAYTPTDSEAGGHEHSLVAVALEALDLSSGSGDDIAECRIKVRIAR